MVLGLGSGKCRKEREAFDSGSDAFGRRELTPIAYELRR
jgi:hypothetical protein